MIEIIRNINNVRIAKICASCQNCLSATSVDSGGELRMCLVPQADGKQRKVPQKGTCSRNYLMAAKFATLKATGKGMVKCKEYLDFVLWVNSATSEAPLHLQQMTTEQLRSFWEAENKKSIYMM